MVQPEDSSATHCLATYGSAKQIAHSDGWLIRHIAHPDGGLLSHIAHLVYCLSKINGLSATLVIQNRWLISHIAHPDT